MAKEQGKEEFETLDESFQGDDEKKSPEAAETATATTEPEKPEEPEEKPEEAPEPEPSEEEKPWEKLGLKRFDGMTQEQIAADILQIERDVAWRKSVVDRQGEELGALRTFKKDKETPEEKPQEEAPLEMPEMTEGEVLDFTQIYQTNPIKAVLKYGGDYIKNMITTQIKDSLPENIKSAVETSMGEQQDSLAYTNFLQRHEDLTTEQDSMMRVLDKEEYLGGQSRPYEDLYQLTVLCNPGSTPDPLYQPTYDLMKQHRTMSLKQAKMFAKQQTLTGETDKTRENLKKDVESIDAVNTTSTRKKVSNKVKDYKTVDEAFDDDTED